MAGTKEIRIKIKSVQSTRKITKAMEMVAASKMRKAQERMRAARPYGDKIRNIAAHIATPIPNTGTRSWSTRDDVEARRRHRRHDRQGPVRRPQHQRAARWCCNRYKELAGAGRARSSYCAIGNKGLGFLQRLGAQRRLARRAARRPAAAREADRPGQGAARRLSRRASSTRCYLSTRASSTR